MKSNLVVKYLRVSRESQGISGLGMEAQRDTVNRFIAGRGMEPIAEFCEVESGKKTAVDRPELEKALALCRKRGATLVVSRLDRLARNALFLLQLQHSNVDFLCVDAADVDRFTIGVLALLAERERILISERTKAALAAAKRRGVKLGTKTPAQQVRLMNAGAHRAKEEFAAKVRPVIAEIRQAGVSTLKGIAECLNRRGIATRTGKTWYPATVRLFA